MGNGKVERSYRTDAEELYRRVTFTSLAELQAKLRQWETEYNQERPHLAMKGDAPAELLREFRIMCAPGLRRTG